MRILHLDEQSGWRGGEQQASYLIQGLAVLGHENHIAGRPGTPFIDADHGGGVAGRLAAPFRGEVDIVTAWRIAQYVRRYRIDILHAHTSHAHSLAYLARSIAGRGFTVVSRRVDFPPKRHALNRLKYRMPHRIIAISECIAQVLRAYGIREDRLRVVHSCIDPARFDVPPLSRAALGLPEDVPILLNVAALVGHKDHATLIEAMPALLEAVPGLRLLIAGDGPLRPAIETRIATLGIGDAVTLLGYRHDVPQLLRTANVFVLSSSKEGLGTSVLDAMACALPIAVTRAGGIPEMITHEQNGLLCPPGNPAALAAILTRLFREPALARRLASAAHTTLHARFTVDRMVAGNLAVYRELVPETNLD